ncbi:MAG: thioredoxin domain-containing protein [Acidobacteria bacterium]|nr:thioredoxin domain-containing protein [Acidobacteriota bacterium]
MPTNRLVDEQSPYLLQHAHNPVEWLPWGEEAFEKARREDKPIFLSVGYSTCHWCHVMERESFENETTAAILNAHFVPVKVDREERPDVDRVYMAFVQATTGGGGWPMSVWLTPQLKPFYGGTYFPPENKYGRPSFRTLLTHLAESWRKDRAKIEESGRSVVEELERHAVVEASGAVDPKVIETGFDQFRRSYDAKVGGFGKAPKFPRPVVFNFLLRYFKQTGNEEALAMAVKTLDEMSQGGMNDQLGGGFHRYSVDARWFVPHFEKMLYDQAQLAVSYLEAFQITGENNFAIEARDIFDYVLRDMTDDSGGFHSAEDADSAADPEQPGEKSEGAFYIWSQEELEATLGQLQAAWFCDHFGVKPEGNVDEDPHREFTGRNILFVDKSIRHTAEHFDVPVGEVSDAIAEATEKLMAARGERPRPHLDDKVLTGWNGLMISALAKGAQVLNEPRYAEAARNAADAIVANLWKDGLLLRRYRDGNAAIPGFLDDYAFFGLALVDLYETLFSLEDLRLAEQIAVQMVERFADPAGGFYSTTADDSTLILRLKEDYDGAEPGGNSMATMLLLRLAAMLGREDFQQQAERTIAAFGDRMAQQTMAVPQMLCAYLFAQSKPRQIVLAGEEIGALAEVVRRGFAPHQVVMRADVDYPLEVVRAMVTETATAYICENFTCQLPATTPEQLASKIQ